MKHARLSASAAHRWMHCAGSVALSAGIEDTDSPYAAEGTLAHAWAASGLSGHIADDIEPGSVPSDEMSDAVNTYVNAVYADEHPDDVTYVEMPLLDALLKIDPDLGGTADFVRYRPSDRSLRVWDFKYGAGLYVEADNNEQLMLYALGALLSVASPVVEVTVTIVQPRYEGAQPIRDYKFQAVALMDFAADIVAAAKQTRSPEATLTPGDWCKFCRAARICPALEKQQHALVALDFKPPVDYNKLAAALAQIPQVKERIKAIEEYAYAEATQGREIPGFKLVDKRANRRWKSEGDTIQWAEKIAVDPYAPRELLSPAQLEKQLKKAEKQELGQFIESVSSGTVLVPASDKRPPAKVITAADFAVVGNADNDEVFPLITQKGS